MAEKKIDRILGIVKKSKEKDQRKQRDEKEKEAKNIGSINGESETRKISELICTKRNRKASDKKIDFYAETIKNAGLLVPIIIDKNNNILDGERRVKACESLGWETVPVQVTDKNYDSVSVMSNYLRENFTPEQVIDRMEYLKNEFGLSQQKIAAACGITQGRVSQLLKESAEKNSGVKPRGSNPGRIPAEKLPHKVAIIVRKLSTDITFKIDASDMVDPATAISDLLKEIKDLQTLVSETRKKCGY